MPAHSPDNVNPAFAAAFNARDLDALLSLYEPEATLVTRTGEMVQGLAAIREVLARFLSFGGTMFTENRHCVINGDLGLVRADWKCIGAQNAGGEPIEIAGRSSEVVRLGSDGTWRVLIDHPFGAA